MHYVNFQSVKQSNPFKFSTEKFYNVVLLLAPVNLLHLLHIVGLVSLKMPEMWSSSDLKNYTTTQCY